MKIQSSGTWRHGDWYLLTGVSEKLNELDVHESLHRDTTMKITNKMHHIN